MEFIQTDVLVIGGGAAGIRAAGAAREAGANVILVAADAVTHSGSTFSKISNGWGIQALVGRERTYASLEDFYNDIIRVGLDQSDPTLARILVEESGTAVEDLACYGIEFKQGPDGKYFRARGCFSEFERAFLTHDIKNIKKTFLSILRQTAVEVVVGYATDLIMDDGTCRGAWIALNSGELLQISAKSVVLATGGGVGIYDHNMGSGGGLGDGYALAHLAGADFINMEFIQFALGLRRNGTTTFLSVADLNQPEKVVDSAGRDILKRYIPCESDRAESVQRRREHMPFSCRDASGLVDLAIARAQHSGEKLYWQNGCPEHDRFEVTHLAHAFNGGIKINEKGESSVPGLFAAGEVAAGAYGADRIGGCMMTATQVFGKRAGRYAAERVRRISLNPCQSKLKYKDSISCVHPRTSDDTLWALETISTRGKEAVGKYAGVLRSKTGLKRCCKILDKCSLQLKALESMGMCNMKRYFEVRNQIITAKLVAESALARSVSLGSHYREDDKDRKLVSSSVREFVSKKRKLLVHS